MDVLNKWGEEMKDTIYREDAIKALRLENPMMPMFKSLREEWAIKTEGFRKAEEVIMSVPSADVQQGDVDAVAIFEREMHNLEQGYITIGEFDERIEPLRHLCYGRPQGEWIKDEDGTYRCSNCGGCEEQFIYGTENWYGRGESKFCPSCGARMLKGADDAI